VARPHHLGHPLLVVGCLRDAGWVQTARERPILPIIRDLRWSFPKTLGRDELGWLDSGPRYYTFLGSVLATHASIPSLEAFLEASMLFALVVE